MSRYTGPRVKVMRALGIDLPGLSRKSIERRPYPPGDHGKAHRRKESVYGIQLKEKQKLKMNYGLTERQMRRLVKKARASKLATGTRMLQLLESRLALRAQAVVLDIPYVLGVTDPGVSNFGAPSRAKLAFVLCIKQPAVGIHCRMGILVALIVANPTAVHLPIAGRVTQPAPLPLV